VTVAILIAPVHAGGFVEKSSSLAGPCTYVDRTPGAQLAAAAPPIINATSPFWFQLAIERSVACGENLQHRNN
jgi:hypothetical protein